MGEKDTPISNMRELFERIKTMNKLTSDKQCWEMIGISPRFYKYVKEGKKHLSNDKAPRIAAMSFLSVEAVLVLIGRGKSASDEETDAWNRIITGQSRIMDSMAKHTR